LLSERELPGGFSESAKKMEKGLEGKKCFCGLEELREIKSAGTRKDGSKE
jgi:hypothetical protein